MVAPWRAQKPLPIAVLNCTRGFLLPMDDKRSFGAKLRSISFSLARTSQQCCSPDCGRSPRHERKALRWWEFAVDFPSPVAIWRRKSVASRTERETPFPVLVRSDWFWSQVFLIFRTTLAGPQIGNITPASRRVLTGQFRRSRTPLEHPQPRPALSFPYRVRNPPVTNRTVALRSTQPGMGVSKM